MIISESIVPLVFESTFPSLRTYPPFGNTCYGKDIFKYPSSQIIVPTLGTSSGDIDIFYRTLTTCEFTAYCETYGLARFATTVLY